MEQPKILRQRPMIIETLVFLMGKILVDDEPPPESLVKELSDAIRRAQSSTSQQVVETTTMKMRGRKVTQDEARASAQRLINSHFRRPDSARASIPVCTDDDDVTVMDYILEGRE